MKTRTNWEEIKEAFTKEWYGENQLFYSIVALMNAVIFGALAIYSATGTEQVTMITVPVAVTLLSVISVQPTHLTIKLAGISTVISVLTVLSNTIF